MMRDKAFSSNDSLTPWLLPGLMGSAFFHLAVAVYYWHQPEVQFVAPPASIPVSVAMVAPVATPVSEPRLESDGPSQQASLDSAPSSPSQKLLDKPLDSPQERMDPVAEPVVNEVALPESPVKELVALAKPVIEPPAKKKKTIQSDQSNKRPEPKVEHSEAETIPDNKTDSLSQVASKAQLAQSQPKVETIRQSEQVQGAPGVENPQLGQVTLTWKQALVIHLEQFKRYPRKAKRLRKQGVPMVRFSMDRTGQVLSADLIRSSGTTSLDEEAIAMVFRAMPLPSPPEELTDDVLTLTVPVRFFAR